MKKTIFTLVAICALTVTAKAQNSQYHCFPDGHCGLVEVFTKNFGTTLLRADKNITIMYIEGDLTDARIMLKDKLSGLETKFKMTEMDAAAGTFTGKYERADGSSKIVEKAKIFPVTEKFLADPMGAAKELGITNDNEVKCSKGDSLVILSSNVTSVVTGNCMTPSGK